VAEARDAARGQLARLDRGEEVSGGLGRPMTQEDCHRILKAAGWTTSDIRHAMDLAELSTIGGEQAFEDFSQALWVPSRRSRPGLRSEAAGRRSTENDSVCSMRRGGSPSNVARLPELLGKGERET
jgi:hypothetical protein